MAHIIVGPPLDLPRPHGQQRLRAIQRLDLRLLVRAQYERAIRRVQVQADDIPHLLDEEGVPRQFEGLRPMRLQTEGPPDPAAVL